MSPLGGLVSLGYIAPLWVLMPYVRVKVYNLLVPYRALTPTDLPSGGAARVEWWF